VTHIHNDATSDLYIKYCYFVIACDTRSFGQSYRHEYITNQHIIYNVETESVEYPHRRTAPTALYKRLLLLLLLTDNKNAGGISTNSITGTVHTSAKTRLTGITIRIRIRISWPDRHQNLIVCSMAHCLLSWKFRANPFGSFCAKLLTDKQTNRQTNNDDYISSLVEVGWLEFNVPFQHKYGYTTLAEVITVKSI